MELPGRTRGGYVYFLAVDASLLWWDHICMLLPCFWVERGRLFCGSTSWDGGLSKSVGKDVWATVPPCDGATRLHRDAHRWDQAAAHDSFPGCWWECRTSSLLTVPHPCPSGKLKLVCLVIAGAVPSGCVGFVTVGVPCVGSGASLQILQLLLLL